MDKLRKMAEKRSVERKRVLAEQEAIKKKQMRFIYSKPYSNFEDIQESHCLQGDSFIRVRAQNIRKLPKLAHESYANVQQEQSESLNETPNSPTASQSSMNLFNGGNFIDGILDIFENEKSEQQLSMIEETKEKYRIGELKAMFDQERWV